MRSMMAVWRDLVLLVNLIFYGACSEPTAAPTAAPTSIPTAAPTSTPTAAPTSYPTAAPTNAPTVPAEVPTGFHPRSLATGSSHTVTMTGGSGLTLKPDTGDKMKIIRGDGSCSDHGSSVVTPNEVTDLGPDDSDPATQAEASFTVGAAGDYKLCYSMQASGIYKQVGSDLLSAQAVRPTVFHPESVMAGSASTVTLTGGSGLRNTEPKDVAKLVPEEGSCGDSASAGGSFDIITASAPSPAATATQVDVAVNFAYAGSYLVCYKTEEGFGQVGNSLFTVHAVAPSAFEPTSVSLSSSSVVVTMTGAAGLKAPRSLYPDTLIPR